MAALNAARNTPEKFHPASRIIQPPTGLAASTTVYAGGIAVENAAGNIVPGSVSTTQKALGRFEQTVVNSGSAGAVTARIKTGIFKFNNSSAGDLIAATELETSVYIVDDNTVAKTNGGSTRSVAGTVKQVDADGVWVAIGLP